MISSRVGIRASWATSYMRLSVLHACSVTANDVSEKPLHDPLHVHVLVDNERDPEMWKRFCIAPKVQAELWIVELLYQEKRSMYRPAKVVKGTHPD